MLTATALAVAIAGCYQVPVSNDLRPYAIFSAENAAVSDDGAGTTTINYDLPQDLTGTNAVHITLTGNTPANDGDFFSVHESANATTGECTRAHGAVTCMLHYAGLRLDADQTASFLTQKYQGDAALPQRLQVMREFSGEPIGIFMLP